MFSLAEFSLLTFAWVTEGYLHVSAQHFYRNDFLIFIPVMDSHGPSIHMVKTARRSQNLLVQKYFYCLNPFFKTSVICVLTKNQRFSLWSEWWKIMCAYDFGSCQPCWQDIHWALSSQYSCPLATGFGIPRIVFCIQEHRGNVGKILERLFPKFLVKLEAPSQLKPTYIWSRSLSAHRFLQTFLKQSI